MNVTCMRSVVSLEVSFQGSPELIAVKKFNITHDTADISFLSTPPVSTYSLSGRDSLGEIKVNTATRELTPGSLLPMNN